MEFSLREWLVLIGVVIIVVILIDGFRRHKRGQEFAESNDDSFELDGSNDKHGNSASNSGSKISHDPTVNAFESARQTVKAPLAEVPHKVDSGPVLDRNEEMHLDELASLVPDKSFDDLAVSEPNHSGDGSYEQDELDFGFGMEADNQTEINTDTHSDEDYERNYSEVDMGQMTPQGIAENIEDDHEDDDDIAEIEEVIVINILAPEEQSFSGMELLQLILNCGMRYGDMDIFHRHEDGFDRGRVQFSMANAIEPGTFDLETMGENDCPGVSFFMGLPGPKNSMKAFDFMLETSQTVVRNLGGELRDERRSPMSEQTIAHCRQRIRDFERRRLMRTKQ